VDVNQEGLKNQSFKKKKEKRKKEKEKRETERQSGQLLTAPEFSAGPKNKERKLLTEKKNVRFPPRRSLFLILVSNDICGFILFF
jgi:hypothetical protein